MTYQRFNDIWLCTRADFQQSRYGGGIEETFDAADNAVQDYFIQQASREIVDRVLFQLPLPYHATLLFDAPYTYTLSGLVNDYRDNHYLLYVGDEEGLLEVTTLTNGDGTTIAASDFVLEPANAHPKFVLRLKTNSNVTFTYTTDWEQAISVEGVWGYVPNYPNAWAVSGATVPAGGLTASATTITFATPADAGLFSAGNYLRIGAETLLVTEANATTGVVTVKRGVLGTTAAEHLAGAGISTFVMLRQIATETARYASHLYNKERAVFDGSGAGLDTGDILESVATRLSAHRRTTV
jgi:hypothetical protein